MRSTRPILCRADARITRGQHCHSRYQGADERIADLPIIVLTSSSMPEDRETYLEAGSNDWLDKPIDRELMFSKIGQYVLQQTDVTD